MITLSDRDSLTKLVSFIQEIARPANRFISCIGDERRRGGGERGGVERQEKSPFLYKSCLFAG